MGEYNYQLGKTVPSSSGVSTDYSEALFAAAGEFYERSSMAKPFSGKKLKFSFATRPYQLPTLTVQEMLELQGLHPFQHHIQNSKLKIISEHTEFDWVRAQKFIDQTDVWLPVDAVTFNSERHYFSVTTNGCAFGTDRENAILNGLLELIERDTLMYFWWRKETPVFVDFKQDLKVLLPDVYIAFGPWLDKISVIYQSGLNRIPVFFTVFHSQNSLNHPAFVMAGAAALNPLQALKKAFFELGAMLNFKLMRQKHFIFNRQKVANFDRGFCNFDDHHTLYMSDQMAEKIYFYDSLKNCKPQIRLREIENLDLNLHENLNLLKSLFLKEQLNPIVVDLTPPSLACLGFHVIRTLDPKIIDLNFAHRERRWGKSRLFGGKIKTIHDLNQFPHPFP